MKPQIPWLRVFVEGVVIGGSRRVAAIRGRRNNPARTVLVRHSTGTTVKDSTFATTDAVVHGPRTQSVGS